MDAGQVGATPHPLLAQRVIPQRADHLPALAVIVRAEQATRQCAAPDGAGLVSAARCQRPDLCGAPFDLAAPHVLLFVAFGLGRIGRCRDLLPAVGGRAVQLDAEMAVVERRIALAVARVGEGQRYVVAQEVDAGNVPVSAVPHHREQTLARRNQKSVAHPRPPDRAWNTWMVLVSLTASPRRARSRIIWPSTKMVICRRSADWSSST